MCPANVCAEQGSAVDFGKTAWITLREIWTTPVFILPFFLTQDRRVTQGELERVRDMFENEVAGLKEELRAVVSQSSPYNAAHIPSRSQ